MNTRKFSAVIVSTLIVVCGLVPGTYAQDEGGWAPPPTPPADEGVTPPSVDAQGFTIFTPSPDTRIVYVSSSTGNDGFDGLSEQTPKRTIQAGKALLRHERPDWLLLRRGDAWNETLGQWRVSGRNMNEPSVIGSYGPGTQRPLLRVNEGQAFGRYGGAGSPPRIEHLAVTGLHFSGEGRGASVPTGVYWVGPGEDVLFEDLEVNSFGTNFVLQSQHEDPVKNVRIRRCVVTDAYNTEGGGGHPQGLYAEGVRGLLIEGNLFDHNGWNADVEGAGPNIFNHNIYIATANSGVSVRGNILARGSSHGLQLRCGGVIENNIVVRNAVGLLLGGGTPDPATHTYGVTGTIRGNVLLEGTDIAPGAERGIGIDIENIGYRGATVQGNILANKISDADGQSIRLGASGYGVGVGCTLVYVSSNVIYNWRGPVWLDRPEANTLLRFNRFDSNIIQEPSPSFRGPMLGRPDLAFFTVIFGRGNRWFSAGNPSISAWVNGTILPFSVWASNTSGGGTIERVRFTDPTRNLATYDASIGGQGSTEGFLSRARRQSRSNWDERLGTDTALDYLRAGFDEQ